MSTFPKSCSILKRKSARKMHYIQSKFLIRKCHNYNLPLPPVTPAPSLSSSPLPPHPPSYPHSPSPLDYLPPNTPSPTLSYSDAKVQVCFVSQINPVLRVLSFCQSTCGTWRPSATVKQLSLSLSSSSLCLCLCQAALSLSRSLSSISLSLSLSVKHLSLSVKQLSLSLSVKHLSLSLTHCQAARSLSLSQGLEVEMC